MSSTSRTATRRLLRDVAALAAAVGAVGVSFGAITTAAGLPAWLVVAMSVLVFAGGSQFMAVGLLAAGNPVTAVLAGLLLNARHLPFGMALADSVFTGGAEGVPTSAEPRRRLRSRWWGAGGVLTSAKPGLRLRSPEGAGGVLASVKTRLRPRRPGGRWSRLAGCHLLVDETVAFALAQPDLPARRRAYWISGGALFVAWNLGAPLGVVLGSAAGDPARFGLDAAFPAGLLALLLPALRNRDTLRVALLGAAVAVLTTPLLPAGLPVLLALTGLAALLLPGRRREVPQSC